MRRSAWLVLLWVATASCVLGQVPQRMRAHFFPVGQAHATLLEFPCGAALIDAGAQDQESATRLVHYLSRFFAGRPDLANTLDLVLITHNHVDHNLALSDVAGKFTIRNYVDDGILTGSGKSDAVWVRANFSTGGRNIRHREVTWGDIGQVPAKSGFADSVIDPVNCQAVDPQIRVLSGRVMKRPKGWTKADFVTANNHTLVTRIDFGAASFLFMGDLEEKGIAMLRNYYSGGPENLLDTDVIQVGHHGSHNATTKELLDSVTPRIAVIPVGAWDFGKGSGNRFTTNAYGHPRMLSLDLLRDAVTGERSEEITVMAGTGPRKFEPYLVRKRIYATAWDGLVRVSATSDGKFVVTRE